MINEALAFCKPVIPCPKIGEVRVLDIECEPPVSNTSKRNIRNREMLSQHEGSFGKVIIKNTQTRLYLPYAVFNDVRITLFGSGSYETDK